MHQVKFPPEVVGTSLSSPLVKICVVGLIVLLGGSWTARADDAVGEAVIVADWLSLEKALVDDFKESQAQTLLQVLDDLPTTRALREQGNRILWQAMLTQRQSVLIAFVGRRLLSQASPRRTRLHWLLFLSVHAEEAAGYVHWIQRDLAGDWTNEEVGWFNTVAASPSISPIAASMIEVVVPAAELRNLVFSDAPRLWNANVLAATVAGMLRPSIELSDDEERRLDILINELAAVPGYPRSIAVQCLEDRDQLVRLLPLVLADPSIDKFGIAFISKQHADLIREFELHRGLNGERADLVRSIVDKEGNSELE